MPTVQANASKPKRLVRTPIPVPVDLTVTPSGGSAGQINSGELCYLTASQKLASLATPGSISAVTLAATISSTGFQHVALSSTAGLVEDEYVTVDTAGNAETVKLLSVDATGVQGNFTKTHNSGVAVACSVQNTVNCVGVAKDVYPHTYTAGVTGSDIPPGDSNVPFVSVYEDGDHLFNTTASDTYHPYDPVYLGADARTVTTVANGLSVGYVSPDQRQSSTSIAQPITTPITGAAGVQIYIHITPALAK